ncbi:hypothetical protein IW140_002576 [Coemansia sp. RSA 1813]|nr:hypothetical protein IW140_002576 [Coemansia sp. RSA 1813]
MSEDNNSNKSTTDTSPNKLHKILSKLSITRTLSRSNSLRSRRGVPTIHELEIQVDSLKLDDQQQELKTAEPSNDDAADLSSSPSKAVYPLQSVQAESVRKRERIAELRRARLNNLVDFQQEQEQEQQPEQQQERERLENAHVRSPGDFVLSPPTSSHIATAVENGSPIPVSARQNSAKSLVSPAVDRFFNSPELNLLLHPIDVESINELDDKEQVPSKRPRSKRQPTPVSPSNEHGMDFKIDIPSTSLSPVVAGGLTMLLRRKSRTTTAQHLQKNRDGVSKLGAALNTGNTRPQTTAGGITEASKKDNEAVVLARIGAERARNSELRDELDRLNSSVDALKRLLLANQVTSKDEDSRELYPPLFSD